MRDNFVWIAPNYISSLDGGNGVDAFGRCRSCGMFTECTAGCLTCRPTRFVTATTITTVALVWPTPAKPDLDSTAGGLVFLDSTWR